MDHIREKHFRSGSCTLFGGIDTVPYFSYDLILPSHTSNRSPVLLKDPWVLPLLKIKRCYLTYFVTYYDRS